MCCCVPVVLGGAATATKDRCSVLQCVSVLQGVAGLQRVVACCNGLQFVALSCIMFLEVLLQPQQMNSQMTGPNKLHNICVSLAAGFAFWNAAYCKLHRVVACRSSSECNMMQHTHTATHCNTLQHTATHCNTLQQGFGMPPIEAVACGCPVILGPFHKTRMQHYFGSDALYVMNVIGKNSPKKRIESSHSRIQSRADF